MPPQPVDNSWHNSSTEISEVIISKRQVCDEASATLSRCRAMMASVDSNFSQYRERLESRRGETNNR